MLSDSTIEGIVNIQNYIPVINDVWGIVVKH